MHAPVGLDLKIHIDAEDKYCSYCKYLMYMGIGWCQLFHKNLKVKQTPTWHYVYRCKDCKTAEKQAK